MNKQEKSVLKQFRQALHELAQKLQTHPRLISRDAFRSGGRGVTEHALKHYFGSFQNARDLALPPEESPFRGYEDLEHHELQELIARLIAECSEILHEYPHELGWLQFRRYINFRYGQNDVGLCDYAISKAGGFPTVRDAFFEPQPTPKTVSKQRTQEHARINRKLGRQASQEQFILDRIESFAKEVFSKAFEVQICCNRPQPAKDIRHKLLLVLSDLHYGSDIDAAETGAQTFGPTEEARRTAHIVRQVAGYRPDLREQTELEILLIGDIVQGSLHDPQDGAALAEQIVRAQRILIQAICYLAVHFPRVRVRISTGNHDRFKEIHVKRAVSQKWNSILWVIGKGIQYAVQANCKNVEFEMLKTPYLSFEVLGRRIFATHGDTVLDLGNPGKALPTGSLEHQTNRINSALGMHDVYIAGHIHRGMFVNLDNGSCVFTNGSITPPGPHAVSLGIMQASCGQWLLHFEEGQDVLSRFIHVGIREDRDPDLDLIIEAEREVE